MSMISRDSIMDVLRTIPDPEMPISIVDLGLVQRVAIDQAGRDETRGCGAVIEIDLLPTFIGCPALDMIAGDVRAKVGIIPGVKSVNVNWVFDPPWTVDRITPEGRASLKVHGVTVPERGDRLPVPGHENKTIPLRTSVTPCPFCGSDSTYLDSAFGPTRCRTIYYCTSCKNSFEHLKKLPAGSA